MENGRNVNAAFRRYHRPTHFVWSRGDKNSRILPLVFIICRPLLDCFTDDNDACPEGNRDGDAFGCTAASSTGEIKCGRDKNISYFWRKDFRIKFSWSVVRC